MEQKFKEWLGEQKTQRGNLFKEPQISNLCKHLRETIPNWEKVNHPNLFTIKDVDIIKKLHKRCRQNGGDLHEQNRSVGAGAPSNALNRYKEFLEEPLKSDELPNCGRDNLWHIKIKGFKSIKELDLKMKPINVLIGANGAGKSNFISVFKFLKYAASDNITNIELYVKQYGGSDTFLFFGSTTTQEINIEIGIQEHQYKLVLSADYNNDILTNTSISSNLDNPFDNFDTFKRDVNGVGVYHFHNTNKTAGFKKYQKIFDCVFLRSDAKNIAPFLYRLKEEFNQDYLQIVQAIQAVAPYFYDFVLEPIGDNNDGNILLRWQHKNDLELDKDFSANQLSDGTARFICMATLFLQPKDMRPQTIVLDEPEIGLHPVALTVLSEIIKSVANDGSQVIIATQSVALANCFEPDDFIVVDYADDMSNFRRLDDKDKLDLWLKDYQMGDIWNKNLLGGRPW